jgi:hypothetical protein
MLRNQPQRKATAQQSILEEGGRILAVEGAGREVSRNQEEEAHEVSLIDEYEYEQRQVRRRIIFGRLQVVECCVRSVDDGQVVQHDQNR